MPQSGPSLTGTVPVCGGERLGELRWGKWMGHAPTRLGRGHNPALQRPAVPGSSDGVSPGSTTGSPSQYKLNSVRRRSPGAGGGAP